MMPMLSLWATLAQAQTADQPWRTIRTEHFRVHYPEVAAVWAEQAAARLETWHDRVVAEVGWDPPGTIDAVVVDPYSDANGLAVPWAGAPRTLWFATPPEAGSVIGHYRAWDEILLVHEDTHLVHMLRAPRNPAERVLYHLFGLGPVATKAPRWVTEGYATVVEGRLTGFGRPNGDLRAILLRRLGQRGELPSYWELDANQRWAGGGYAYLVGSAYLEWLEQRAGEGALRDLWARMSARQIRSFDEAFQGVFGDRPEVLYARFAAEVTAAALAVEAEDPPADTLFQTLGWTVGAPDVAPDGSKVAVPHFPRQGVPRIEVWSLSVDEEAQKEHQDAITRLLERDPEDVAPVPPAHPPHERLNQRLSEGYAARELRWTVDGEALLFSAWTRDPTGRYRPDLYRWTLDGRRTERLTRGGDLRAPDPAPDGTWAAAVHLDWGQTQIVRVDLETGEQAPLTPLSLVQVDGPRISPDGRRVAWTENAGRAFGVVVLDLDTGRRWSTAPGPDGLTAYSLAWSGDGRSLFATAGIEGFVEIHEVWRDGGLGRGRMSATGGTAAVADPIDGESALYLSMTSAGLDLSRVALGPTPVRPASGAPPVRRPALPSAPPLPEQAPVQPEPYGLGPTDLSLFAGSGVAAASGQGQIEIGARVGDPVGRSELLLMAGAALDRGGAYGGRASWTLRALPVRVGVDGYLVGDDAFDTRRSGIAAELADRVDGPWWGVDGRVAALVEGALPGDEHGPRQLAYLGVGAAAGEPSQRWVGGAVSLRGTVGRVDGAGAAQGVAGASVRVLRSAPIRLSYRLGLATGDGLLDRFALGGLSSSLSYGPSQLWRVPDPAFPADIVRGRIHEQVELALDTPVGVYVERHRIGDALPARGLSAGGVRVKVDVAEQPFFRLPPVRTDTGVACRFEYPGLGFDPKPCQQLSDYTFWASVTFGR